MLILGCGYTGLQLARSQVAHGHRVRGVVSSAASAEQLKAENITAQHIDFDAPGADTDRLHTIGSTVYLIPPPRSTQDDPRLANALEMLRTTRLVYVSTTGVYGNRDGARVSEHDTPKPESDRAVRRLAAESMVRGWCEANDIEWVILRVPGIYGPDRLQLATIQSRRPMLEASAAGPGNRIHVDDLVRCLEAAVSTPHTNRVYNVGDGNPMTNTEFVAEVARQVGAQPPPTVDRETMRANASPQAWSFMRESRLVDISRMHSELGVVAHYTEPREGIAASLAQMRGSGED